MTGFLLSNPNRKSIAFFSRHAQSTHDTPGLTHALV